MEEYRDRCPKGIVEVAGISPKEEKNETNFILDREKENLIANLKGSRN